MKLKTNNRKLIGQMQLMLLALPGIIWFFIFCYIPMAGSVVAFKDYKPNMGIWGSKWVGFKNFEFLFSSSNAVRIVRNTLIYNFASIIIVAVVAVIIALLMNNVRRKIYIKAYQTMLFLPRFISWVVVGYMALIFFHYEYGIFNHILEMIGMEKISWYQEPNYWWAILIIFNVWKVMGYTSLIYYGSIIGIDESLYESAEIDGANGWTKTWKITLPLIRPTIIILSLMSIGSILRADFGLFYYVTNDSGSLYSTTDVLDTYIYRALKGSGDIAGSAAASFFQSVIGFIMIMISNNIVNKIDSDSALF